MQECDRLDSFFALLSLRDDELLNAGWNMSRSRGIVCDNANSSGLDLETGEITFGARSDPEGHAARGITEFEIIHNQTGLAGAVDIQAGLLSLRP